MMLAISYMLTQCHTQLKEMMECPGRGFEWSYTHNSPFEFSKTALMNFPRSHKDPVPEDLTLDKPNFDVTFTSSATVPILSYQYLSVIFDLKLHCTLQQTKAHTVTSFQSSRIWRPAKSTSGLSILGAKQLYNTEVISRFTYSAVVWYTYLHKPANSNQMRGLVNITNKLYSVQHNVTKVITR